MSCDMVEDQFSQISYLMIEVNSFCNLECAFCNRKELAELGFREQKLLTPDEFKKALDIFKDCRIDTIKLEGLSEPMFHPQFDECAKILRDYFPKANIIIATNLQYNIDKVPFAKSLPFVNMCYLSIDGVDDVFEKARPGAKYPKLIKCLDWIKENIDPEVRKSKLHINHVSTIDNFHQLDDVYKLKDNYGLASVRINLAQNWNEHESNEHQLSEEYLNVLKKHQPDVKGVANWTFSDCFWPYEGLIVDVFGDVRQCIINTSQKPIANIYTDNIREVFNNSKHYSELRNCLKKDSPHSACQNCDYKSLAPKLKKAMGNRADKIKPREFLVK